MKNIFLIFLGIILISTLLLLARSFSEKKMDQPIPSPSFSPIVSENVDISASFTIITDSITRNFSAAKYHNQSADVYIESSNPTLVHVKKVDITWNDFFKTLPMKLTKNCLTTGDGENYCDMKDGSLRFYLNDQENKDLLDKEIKQGDKVLIKFVHS